MPSESPPSDRMLDTVHRALKNSQRQPRVTGRLVTLSDGPVAVLGDIHGDLDGLNQFLKKTGLEERLRNPSQKLVFLGDYIDRGPSQLGVLSRVFRLYLDHPRQVVLIRGNHEGPSDLPCYPNDFRRLLASTYGDDAAVKLDQYQGIFDSMFTAALIPGRAVLLHGGFPSSLTGPVTLADAHKVHPAEPHLKEILWSDPTEEPGVRDSPRGAGKLFGPDVTRRCLAALGVNTLIRGHQSTAEGFSFTHGCILTLFSCKVRAYRNQRRAGLDAEKGCSFRFPDLMSRVVSF